MSHVKIAVFPVAGLGTRFLPATKSVPKEMLPLVDRPVIQYAVEQAVERAADAVDVFVEHGIDTMMNRFNRDDVPEPSP